MSLAVWFGGCGGFRFSDLVLVRRYSLSGLLSVVSVSLMYCKLQWLLHWVMM